MAHGMALRAEKLGPVLAGGDTRTQLVFHKLAASLRPGITAFDSKAARRPAGR
jgi:hypothetical protein